MQQKGHSVPFQGPNLLCSLGEYHPALGGWPPEVSCLLANTCPWLVTLGVRVKSFHPTGCSPVT